MFPHKPGKLDLLFADSIIRIGEEESACLWLNLEDTAVQNWLDLPQNRLLKTVDLSVVDGGIPKKDYFSTFEDFKDHLWRLAMGLHKVSGKIAGIQPICPLSGMIFPPSDFPSLSLFRTEMGCRLNIRADTLALVKMIIDDAKRGDKELKAVIAMRNTLDNQKVVCLGLCLEREPSMYLPVI